MQVKREIKALMLEEGYSEQEIREQIDDLADEEMDRRKQMEQQERQEKEAERQEREAERQHELLKFEQRKAEREHELKLAEISASVTGKPSSEKKVTFYDEDTDLEAFLDIFDMESKDIEEDAKIFMLKKAFMKSKIASSVTAYVGNDVEELKDIIRGCFNRSPEFYQHRFRNTRIFGKNIHEYSEEIKNNFNKWLKAANVQNDFEKLTELVMIEQFKNGLNKKAQEAFVNLRLYNKNIQEIIEQLIPYTEYINKEKEKSGRIICFICKKPGHMQKDCYYKNKNYNRNFKNNEKKRTRQEKVYIATKDSENCEYEDHEEAEDSDQNVCYNINNGRINTFQGKINGKAAQIMRDSGCTTAIVKKKFVDDKHMDNGKTTLKFANGDSEVVPTANVCIESPIYSGETRVACFDTEFDAIIGNIPGAKCLCAVETENPGNKDFIKVQENDETLKECWNKAKMNLRNFKIKDNILYKINETGYYLVCVPLKFRENILYLAHDSIGGGHLGVEKTLNKIQREFYWPNLNNDVADYCRTCSVCQKYGPRVQKAPLKSIPVTPIPFLKVGIDLIGPFMTSGRKQKYVLTMIDYATRYPDSVVIPNKKLRTIAGALMKIFSRIGFPKYILSDQEPTFMSAVINEMYKCLGIKALHSSPYHPQCNGLTENFQRTLKNMIKKFTIENPRDWDLWLDIFLFAYRDSKHKSTGFTPFQLLYGHETRGPLSIIRNSWINDPDKYVELSDEYVEEIKEKLIEFRKKAEENISDSQRSQEKYYNKNTKLREFKENEEVWVLLPNKKNSLILEWQGPYKVLKKHHQSTI